MERQAGEEPGDLASAIELLASLGVVVRFHADGRVRLACVHPADEDGRVVVVASPHEEGVCAALVEGAERLAAEHQAARLRPSLQLVR